MKNYENTALLAAKREFDRKRREAAIEARRQANLAAIRKVGGQK